MLPPGPAKQLRTVVLQVQGCNTMEEDRLEGNALAPVLLA